MNKLPKAFLIFSCFTVMIISTIFAFANVAGENKILEPFGLGQKFSHIDRYPKEIIIINNKIPITRGEFDYVFSVMSKEDHPAEEIIKSLVQRKLLYEIAKTEEVAISESEAIEIVQKEKELFQSFEDEHKQYLLEFMEGMSITEEEYWNNYFLKDVIVFESINNLGKKVVHDAIQNEQLAKEPSLEDVEAHKEWANLISEYFNDWAQKQVNSATVDVIDKDYLNNSFSKEN